MLTFLEQLARLHSSWKQMILVIQSIKGVNAIFHLQFLFFFFPLEQFNENNWGSFSLTNLKNFFFQKKIDENFLFVFSQNVT